MIKVRHLLTATVIVLAMSCINIAAADTQNEQNNQSATVVGSTAKFGDEMYNQFSKLYKLIAKFVKDQLATTGNPPPKDFVDVSSLSANLHRVMSDSAGIFTDTFDAIKHNVLNPKFFEKSGEIDTTNPDPIKIEQDIFTPGLIAQSKIDSSDTSSLNKLRNFVDYAGGAHIALKRVSPPVCDSKDPDTAICVTSSQQEDLEKEGVASFASLPNQEEGRKYLHLYNTFNAIKLYTNMILNKRLYTPKVSNKDGESILDARAKIDNALANGDVLAEIQSGTTGDVARLQATIMAQILQSLLRIENVLKEQEALSAMQTTVMATALKWQADMAYTQAHSPSVSTESLTQQSTS